MSYKPANFRVPVIYYHSIGPVNGSWFKNYLTIENATFEKHLQWITNRYNVITLKELWEIKKDIRNPVERPLIINFDDGYLDNWIWAYPLLKKYGIRATIFISPEFTDSKGGVRPNINDYESGNAVKEDLENWGFLSWDEMKIMENSGFVDIQSHTRTHTKYFVSERLTGFYRPDADILYPVVNRFPEWKPYYIGNREFLKLLPNGTPLFEEETSVLAKRVFINPDFEELCVDLLGGYDFCRYNFNDAFRLVKPYYDDYIREGKIITKQEGDREYEIRVQEEIAGSKRIIEEKLGKKVEFLCWPHGGNNEYLHRLALDEGYLMTTTGRAPDPVPGDNTRIPERMGMNFRSWWRKQKTISKLKAFSGISPWTEILRLSRHLRRDKG